MVLKMDEMQFAPFCCCLNSISGPSTAKVSKLTGNCSGPRGCCGYSFTWLPLFSTKLNKGSIALSRSEMLSEIQKENTFRNDNYIKKVDVISNKDIILPYVNYEEKASF